MWAWLWAWLWAWVKYEEYMTRKPGSGHSGFTSMGMEIFVFGNVLSSSFPTRRETSFTWIFDICEFFSSRVNAVGWPCGLAGSVVALDVQRNPKLRRVRYLHTAPGPGNQCLDFSQLGKRDGKNCH